MQIASNNNSVLFSVWNAGIIEIHIGYSRSVKKYGFQQNTLWTTWPMQGLFECSSHAESKHCNEIYILKKTIKSLKIFDQSFALWSAERVTCLTPIFFGKTHGYILRSLSVSFRTSVTKPMTITIGDGTKTQCSNNTRQSMSARRKRQDGSLSGDRSAENGALMPGLTYTAFIRAYVVADDNQVGLQLS